MQQSAPTPTPAQAPAPPAPAAPPAPTAVIALPGGSIPLEGLPQTAQQLEGLRTRREILRDQLARATNRRDELAGQLEGGTVPEARVGIQQRLAVLDERILQIEREQANTERLLSNAPAEVLALAAEAPDPGAMVSEDDALIGASAAFGFGVLLTLLAQRLRRRRARRRAEAAGAGATRAGAAALSADPRFEQLTQAVEAMAEEVERIGEGQRFVTQLLAGQRDAAAALRGQPVQR